MKYVFATLLLLTSIQSFGEKNKLDLILEEGQLLYRLELAAWLANDHFLKNFSTLESDFGGYVSYETDYREIKTVFFSKGNINQIIATYDFGKSPNESSLSVDSNKRNSTKLEQTLINMRIKTRQLLISNKSKYFKFYKNVSFNIIPLITDGINRVILMSASRIPGVVIFGNDYELMFDDNLKLTKQRRIHKSIIELKIPTGESDKIEYTHHTHLINPFIDPTDICTMLLYQGQLKCDHHIIIGRRYTTTFNVHKQTLTSTASERALRVKRKKSK